MTLTRRLVLGAVFVAVVLALGVTAATQRQKSNALSQLDSRLERAVPTARTVVKRIDNGSKAQKGLEAALSDVWLGRFDDAGRPVTLIPPMDDAELVPLYTPAGSSTRPTTVGTAAGRSGKVRILTAKSHDNGLLILAVSTENIDRTIADLTRINVTLIVVILALLGLMLWWTIVLGATPIRKMTEAAAAIAQGDTEGHIEVNRASTESTRLAEALNEMVDALRLSEQRMKRFVADASHELRTPLTTLRGYSDLYESGALRSDADIADAMRRIRSESDRMNNIINDLLVLRTADETTMVRVPSRIDSLVVQCANDLRAVQPLRRIEVSVEAAMAPCDPLAITQCVMALGMNALEHTNIDATVTMTVFGVGRSIRFEISDTGDGISEVHLPHVFERLYRVDSSRSDGNGHSGIGLSIVAASISAHGGRYGVESQVGLGSTFWFEIPALP